MNSNSRSGNPQTGGVSLNNYQFDFGVTGSRSSGTSLNGQRNQNQQQPSASCSSSSSYSSQSQPPSSRPLSSFTSSWTPNKPSWTHQPAPGHASGSSLSNPTSMVGDIFGKSWASAAPSSQSSHLATPKSNPNLFGDLVGSSLMQPKNTSVPLKNAAAAASSQRNSFGMGDLGDSLPKAGSNPMRSDMWDGLGNVSSGAQSNKIGGANLGGPPMKTNSNGIGGSAPINAKKDPFGSLVDFGSKPSASPLNKTSGGGESSFGTFQNAAKPAGAAPSFPSDSAPPVNNNFSSSSSFPQMDDFGDFSTHSRPSQMKGGDPLDMLFSSSPSVSASAAASNQAGSKEFTGGDDWGLGSEFGGHDAGGTTELEGLPPPPAGVTASAAKTKGMDNYKQGQFADAIKWLSWATILLEKSGDNVVSIEVLSCRASCYKEVGEYKKAIADCTKILQNDAMNVSVLLQRALLYESSEKYKLGAEDLRAVLKIDPTNRLAKGTIHRLTKLAE